MTIREALQSYPTIEIDLLLAHILKKTKEFLFVYPKQKLTAGQYKKLDSLANRRLRGEPIAYLLRHKYFYDLKFLVTKDVLIPRPETELLVEATLDIIREYASKIKTVLEVGTGSGCVAIAIAKNSRSKNLRIIASDVSTKALSVAKRNAKNHNVQIKFISSDLLNKAKEPAGVIVANLPYGWKAWKNNSSMATKGLAYEPALALFTKKKGLALIEKLLKQIQKLKHKPVAIILEFDPRQKNELSHLIKKIFPKSKAKFLKDSNNHWRAVVIKSLL